MANFRSAALSFWCKVTPKFHKIPRILLEEASMKKLIVFLVSAATLFTSAGPVLAHHGRGATYDMKKEISLQGTISEVSWRNPHIAILLDVKDADGKVTTWTIEHSNITTLAMQGYGRTTLKVGQEVTAVIHPGAAGTPIGLCVKFLLPDGRQVFQRTTGVD
jgi:hypothetical protein